MLVKLTTGVYKGDELVISRAVSQSLNDLSGKISEIKESQIESQNEFLSLISRLTTSLQVSISSTFYI